MNVTIVYFSASGNTKEMSDVLARALRDRSCRVLVTSLDEARRSDVSAADVLLFGSPAWSGERVVQPLADFVHGALERLRGKKVAFFGSYDWGEGRYFDGFAEELRQKGLQVHPTALVCRAADETLTAERANAFLADLLGTCDMPACDSG